MELKLSVQHLTELIPYAFNRTNMELKLGKVLSKMWLYIPFNRTNMELKSHRTYMYTLYTIILLIVPIWN